MSESAASKKARQRSRLRRKMAGASAPAANDAAVEGVAGAAPEGADAEDDAADNHPSAQVVAFPLELDENESPPFDPPDDADDIFGPEEIDETVDAPRPANDTDIAGAVVLEGHEAGSTLRAGLLEIEEDEFEDVFVSMEPPHAEPAAPPEADELRLQPPQVQAAEEEVVASAAAVAAPAASADADDDVPFDPPDEEEAVFREVRIDETMGMDGELLLRPPPAEPAPPKTGGLTRSPRPEPRPTAQPAPAISIHLSWDRPEVAEQLAALAADKRLARTEITSGRGGVLGAVAHCRDERPDVLILDTTLNNAAMLAALDRLADVASGAKVIVIGAVNDIGLLRELSARGVAEYMVPPLEPARLVDAICGLYAETDNSHVIAVMGARGGVGASTIARNIAWSIAERQQLSAALVDLDLPFGAAALSLGADAAHTLADLLAAEDADAALDRAACRVSDRLTVYAAPADPACDLELDAPSAEHVIAAVRRASPHVVLDLPHQWSEGVRAALARADDIVIVSSPDLASLRNTDNLLKHLKDARKDLQPLVLLSMVGVPKRPEITLKDFTEAVGAAPLLAFAYDPALFGQCANEGKSLYEAAPRSKPAVAIDELATLLTGREPCARKKPARKVAAPPAVVDQPPPAPVAAAEAGEEVQRREEDAQPAPEALEAPPPCEEPAAVLTENDWLAMFGEAAPRAEPAPQTAAPEAPAQTAADIPNLPLLELIEAAPAHAASGPRAHALPATRAYAPPPPRRRSTGLIRTAAALIAALALVSWYVEQRRQSAEAAEPLPASAPAPLPEPFADPAGHLAAYYQRALTLLETGAAVEGASLLRRLADSGFPMAQYRLAKLYETGGPVEADLVQARRWIERAANAGNVQAMHDLGVFFSRDETAPRDEAAAFRWFRQAADYDVRDSQFNLGIIYQQGRGVAVDRAEALFWFTLAAQRHNDAIAADRAAQLAAELTPMQREQAQARAAAFTPRTPEPVANGVFAAPAAAPSASPALPAAGDEPEIAVSRQSDAE